MNKYGIFTIALLVSSLVSALASLYYVFQPNMESATFCMICAVLFQVQANSQIIKR